MLLAVSAIVGGGLAASSANAATLNVTTTNDETTPGDGQCSLREAIAAANAPGAAAGDCGTADPTSNTIVLGAHTYLLSIGFTPTDDQTTGDLDVNATREKHLTNIRSSTAEVLVRLVPHRQLSLDQALEFLRADECVEVTPGAVRLRNLRGEPIGWNCTLPHQETIEGERDLGMGGRRDLAVVGNLANLPQALDRSGR